MAIYKACVTSNILRRYFQIQTVQKYFSGAFCYHTATVCYNSNKTSITRCGRPKFERSYPVLLVRPDGSTVNIKYKEPKRILVMPVDVSTLSEEERKARLQKHKQKKTFDKPAEEELDDHFKVDDYSKFWKK